jgi:hypothetical protein
LKRQLPVDFHYCCAASVHHAVHMRTRQYSYRFAAEVLASRAFRDLKRDIAVILEGIKSVPQLDPPKRRRRAGKTMTFTTDQLALNKIIEGLFRERGWEVGPLVTNDGITNIRADFKKGRVQVEVQFGNMARWYTDVFKFQVSYSLGLVDVGVLVAPMQVFANTIDENVAHFERITRELPYAKMSISLPIWVLGVEP